MRFTKLREIVGIINRGNIYIHSADASDKLVEMIWDCILKL